MLFRPCAAAIAKGVTCKLDLQFGFFDGKEDANKDTGARVAWGKVKELFSLRGVLQGRLGCVSLDKLSGCR